MSDDDELRNKTLELLREWKALAFLTRPITPIDVATMARAEKSLLKLQAPHFLKGTSFINDRWRGSDNSTKQLFQEKICSQPYLTLKLRLQVKQLTSRIGY